MTDTITATPVVSVTETPTTAEYSSGSTPAPEAKVEAKPAEEAPFSRRLAEIARRERVRVESEQRFKAERDTWETTRKEYDPVLEAIKNFKANPNDPETAFKLLEASNISYEELTNRILSEHSAPEAPKEKTVEERIEEALAKKDNDRQQADLDNFLKDYRTSIEQNAKSKADEYKFINSTDGAYDMVFDLCVNYYDKYKTELDPEIATQEVENALKEQNTAELERLSKLLGTPAAKKATAPAQTDLGPVDKVSKEIALAGYGNNTSRRSESVSQKATAELSKDEALNLMLKQLRSN